MRDDVVVVGIDGDVDDLQVLGVVAEAACRRSRGVRASVGQTAGQCV
jgi:hypothetical protein